MELVEGRTLSDVLRKDGSAALETALRWIEGDRRRARRGARAPHPPSRHQGREHHGHARRRVKVLDFGLAKLRDDGRRLVSTAPRCPKQTSRSTRRCRASRRPTRRRHSTRRKRSTSIASYQTHAGSLLGTPLYMAPEQIAGAAARRAQRGVLGRRARVRAARRQAAVHRDVDRRAVPQITRRARRRRSTASRRGRADRRRARSRRIAAARFPTMAALRDAVAAERKRLFAPAARRWPLVAAAVARRRVRRGHRTVSARTHRAPPERPGDEYVTRALEEYDVFYNDKALSSLRAALRDRAGSSARERVHDPVRRRAIRADRDARDRRAPSGAPRPTSTARTARSSTPRSRTPSTAPAAAQRRAPRRRRAARIASSRSGPPSSTTAPATTPPRATSTARCSPTPRRAVPRPHLRSLLVGPALLRRARRGAARSARCYRDAFPGEADAVGVYATTLAAAGKLDRSDRRRRGCAPAQRGRRHARGAREGASRSRAIMRARRSSTRNRSSAPDHAPPDPPRGAGVSAVDRRRGRRRATRPSRRACRAAPTRPPASAAPACGSPGCIDPAHAEDDRQRSSTRSPPRRPTPGRRMAIPRRSPRSFARARVAAAFEWPDRSTSTRPTTCRCSRRVPAVSRHPGPCTEHVCSAEHEKCSPRERSGVTEH